MIFGNCDNNFGFREQETIGAPLKIQDKTIWHWWWWFIPLKKTQQEMAGRSLLYMTMCQVGAVQLRSWALNIIKKKVVWKILKTQLSGLPKDLCESRCWEAFETPDLTVSRLRVGLGILQHHDGSRFCSRSQPEKHGAVYNSDSL